MIARPDSAAPATLVDWRHVAPERLDACYARERAHWHDVLAWDSAWTWQVVERARTEWGLPGFVALDDAGDPRGWSFHVRDGAILRIGGLFSDSPDITRQLVDATVDTARRAATDGARDTSPDAIACFIALRAPGLAGALAANDLVPEPFLYMACPLTASWPEPAGGALAEAWNGDVAAAAHLLASSYSRDAARHFTVNGSAEDWRRYIGQLVEQPGCGAFDPETTMMVRDERGLAGLAIMTTLAASTAHVAQIAVRPDRRGTGLATRMLTAAARRATERGRTLMTLIVNERNDSALRVYRRLGFSPRATFIAARADMRR